MAKTPNIADLTFAEIENVAAATLAEVAGGLAAAGTAAALIPGAQPAAPVLLAAAATVEILAIADSIFSQ